MRGSRLALLLCLVCATLVHAAPAAADHVVTVTPDADLKSGDVVTYEASGLDQGNAVVCEAVIALGPGPQSCGAPSFNHSTVGTSVTGTYPVQRFIGAQLMAQVDCAVVACGIQIENCSDGCHAVVAPITFRPEPAPRPDAILKRRTAQGELIGDNIYQVDTTQGLGHAISPGGTWSFALRLQNDGEAADDLRVRLGGGDFNGFSGSVSYFVGYYDVTALVNGPGFVFQDVPVGETRKMAVQFRAGNDAPGSWARVVPRLTSDTAPEVRDAVSVGVLVL